jgi:hypothetical protein
VKLFLLSPVLDIPTALFASCEAFLFKPANDTGAETGPTPFSQSVKWMWEISQMHFTIRENDKKTPVSTCPL